VDKLEYGVSGLLLEGMSVSILNLYLFRLQELKIQDMVS
jgi:hypothetical protein